MSRVQIRLPENVQKKVTELSVNTCKIRGSLNEHLDKNILKE